MSKLSFPCNHDQESFDGKASLTPNLSSLSQEKKETDLKSNRDGRDLHFRDIKFEDVF